MTKHFRPDNVVAKRFGGRRQRWTDPRDYRSGSGKRLSVATTGAVLAAALVFGLAAGISGSEQSAAALAARAPAGAEPAASANIPFFGYCHSGGGTNCVVDGDTFYFGRDKVRIAGIDAPETHPPRCADEARLGEAATHRLRDLLNSGAITLSRIDRDEDVYGRKLRNVAVGGNDVGEALIGEGLARAYAGGRRSWCA